MGTASLELVAATAEDLALFEHLYGYYLHDLSEFSDDLKADASGRFDLSEVVPWFEEDARIPLKIVLDGVVVGFILCTEAQSADLDFVIQDAFVLRGQRGKGVGKEVLRILFESYPGSYWLAVLKDNLPAREFWQRGLKSLGIAFQTGEIDLHGEACDFMKFDTRP